MLISVTTAYSQITDIKNPIIAWQFAQGYEDASGNSFGTEKTISSTTTHPNLEISVLKRGLGVGVPTGRVVRTFNGAFPNGGTKLDAKQNNRYFEFSVQARAGYNVSLTALRVMLRRTDPSPNTYRWAFSVNEHGKAANNMVFTEIGNSDVEHEEISPSGDLQPKIDLFAIEALQYVPVDSVITFRLYAWGATATDAPFAIGKSSNNVALAIDGVVTPLAMSTSLFAPWDTVIWADHYDQFGKITKPFQLSTDVDFAFRSSPWKPEFSTSYPFEVVTTPGIEINGNYLFEIVKSGIEINGNGVVIDIATTQQNQPLENLYSAGNSPWTNGVPISGVLYALPQQSGVKQTVIKNFTLKGFDRGIRLGNSGIAHPITIDNCAFARNRFALYTNGDNAIMQNCSMVENGYGAIYSGSKSNSNTFQNNIFRDNALTQNQPSYGDFIGDAFYNTNIINNTFLKPLVTNPALKHIGISIYRNAGEGNSLRTEIPNNIIIQNNRFEGYSMAVHVGSRMGRYPSYDISKEGRDYAFYNVIKNNDIIDCSIGIKLSTEGNTIDGNNFVSTNHPIVLHPVFFTLKNTTINNQANETVDIWYVKSDYSTIPNQSFLFDFHDDANELIPRNEKRVEVFSTIGTPAFTAVGGVNSNEFKLNPTPPADLLLDHRVGNPIVKRYGEFQQNLPGDEIVAIWDKKISRIRDVDYYSILIFDQYGTEINRCGRSEIGWSQLAVGYFIRTAGEMEIATVPKTAIDGKYPVYIFRRGFEEPTSILYPENTDPNIQISTDTNHHLVVTFGALPLSLLYFNGKLNSIDSSVTLTWQTTNEVNTKEFIIEKKADDTAFVALGTIRAANSAGNHNYLFIDNNVGSTVNYYRLRQVNGDDTYKYSEIITVEMQRNLIFNISPNPVENTLNITHKISGVNEKIKVFSADGRELIRYNVPLGSVKTSLNVSSLNSGIYILVYEGKKEKSALKFVKK